MIGSKVAFDELSLQFDGGVRAIDNVSFEIPPGEIVALVGPSGCGKTSILRVMAGLQQPTTGQLNVTPNVDGRAGEIGYVFQQPSLLRWRTAKQNVMLPLELSKTPSTRVHRNQRADELLETVGLQDAGNRFPDELSGGMKMRVSIARALITQPRLLLLDEPFAALDDMLRRQLGELLLDLWRDQRFTAVMVTHNIGEAITLSHRLILIDRGRLSGEIENDLPWPRSDHLRRTPEFGQRYGQVSDALREAIA